ncbi:MAG: stage IV sporulation protein A [Clostridia bacterium]|nr:stage IV sporulation protein A [Clostridia bacterium]
MSNQLQIYQDIAARTGGDIYIGVVGPVRTGKSTFIKRFMENVVLPRMEEGAGKERATDEIPQSATGKTVMTTEPKFVPEEAVRIELESGLGFRVKLVDCVGFPVPGAAGLTDENGARYVHTPWSEEAVPFEKAAEEGTEKVIRDHATVGIVITTDGSIGEIGRENYLEAEKRVISEMKETQKPFVVLLNSQHPNEKDTAKLAASLAAEYAVPVVAENVYQLNADRINAIMERIVLEFPLKSAAFRLPGWLMGLEPDHPLRSAVLSPIVKAMERVEKTGDVFPAIDAIRPEKSVEKISLTRSDLGRGDAEFEVSLTEAAYYDVVSEKSGLSIENEDDLMRELSGMAKTRRRYQQIEKALNDAERMGYGIVEPGVEDLKLEEPEIVKQPGGYGVKFKASAPSLHLIRTNVKAEVFPIVGSERQSEDIVKYLLKEFEADPGEIWNSNMFGKSLYELVSESISAKLGHLEESTRGKFAETLEKIVNEGSGGLICIIL